MWINGRTPQTLLHCKCALYNFRQTRSPESTQAPNAAQ
jgi:hypothetical protein